MEGSNEKLSTRDVQILESLSDGELTVQELADRFPVKYKKKFTAIVVLSKRLKRLIKIEKVERVFRPQQAGEQGPPRFLYRIKHQESQEDPQPVPV